MGSVNKVILVGRLGHDPEKKITTSGSSLLRLSLATNEVFNDKSGQRQERTEWHKLVFWGKLADIAAQHLKKGSQIYAEGSLRTNEWQDREGQKRYTTEISISSFRFLDTLSETSQAGVNPGYPSRAKEQETSYAPPPSGQPPGMTNLNEDFIEDDVPF